MKSRPLLSICIAVFNLEQYIEQCLDSVLNQSFKDYEILLIDNGSTDRSIEICEQYAKKYNCIRYTKLPLPTVIGRPFIYGRNNYEGEYFMVIDGDDYLTDGALQNIANAIKDSNCADLIMGSFVCDIEEGMTNFKDANFDAGKINGVSYKKVLDYLTTLPNFHTFQWRFILKRGLFDAKTKNNKIKMANKELISRFNDAITVTAYLVCAKSIWFIEKPFYVYRRRRGSLSDPRTRGEYASDFLKTFIAVANNRKKEIEKHFSYRKKYVLHMLQARFEMFRQLMMEISDERWQELGLILEKHKKILPKLKGTSKSFCELYEYIKSEKTVQEGLYKYRDTEKNRVIEKLKSCQGKKIYVFPTGMCGESMCKFIKDNGVKVEAFLDNDEMKSGIVFEGTECRLPQILEKENIAECCVFIATAYEKNIEAMKSQMMKYGVLEENILIR